MAGSTLRMADFAVRGVPGITALHLPVDPLFEVYKPVDLLEVHGTSDSLFIFIGFTGTFGRLMLDVRSGNVIETSEDASYVSFVNTYLGAFVQCLEVLSSILSGGVDKEDEELASDFEAEILRIDSPACGEGNFWYEIRWAIAIGDFS